MLTSINERPEGWSCKVLFICKIFPTWGCYPANYLHAVDCNANELPDQQSIYQMGKLWLRQQAQGSFIATTCDSREATDQTDMLQAHLSAGCRGIFGLY